MKSLGLILLQLLLLDFCFKNLNLSDMQLALDFYLTTVFVIITSFEPILLVCFLQPKQQVCILL